MKSGKRLGGQPPRRGGRLTGPPRDRDRYQGSPQALGVLALGCLILGVVAGFALGMDRQVRGGILRQRVEAMARPDWVALAELPPYVAPAFTLVVDPGFATEGALRTRAERATTIPRELVREIHLLHNGLGAEAREMVMAPVLEQRATEEQLLELYLNRVRIGTANGSPIYGLYHASTEYLGKEPAQLTLSEVATLAGLLLEPRIADPQEEPGAVGVRRNEVLRRLVATGEITAEEYAAAIAERLPFQPGLSDPPMSRRIPTPQDTVVIRLPPQYRPQPEEPSPEG